MSHVQVNCLYYRFEKMWRDCHLGPGMRAPHLALEVAGDLGPNPGQTSQACGQVGRCCPAPPAPNPCSSCRRGCLYISEHDL